MKKTFVFVVLLSTMFLIFSVTASAGLVMDRIIKKGELVVGTSGAQPPMTAITKKGELIGLDIDIAKAMADALEVKVKFITMPFDNLLPALETKQIDIILSGMTITPKRNQKVAFVGPYYISGKGILAVVKEYAALEDVKKLNTPDVTVAFLKNSTSQKFAETLIPKAKFIPIYSYKEAIDFLLNGKIDALVADYYFCALAVSRYKDKELIARTSPLTFEPLGIAMNEDTLLINWMQNFLKILQGSGKIKKMGEKWLNPGPWIDELP